MAHTALGFPHAPRSTAAIWDELLSLQAELFIPNELAFFLEAPDIRRADNILDVGCGNGDYLASLATYLPETRFTGIDLSAELIGAAARRHSDPQLGFAQGDFFAYAPTVPHDAILLRFVVQHLSDFGAVLDHAATCLAPGGSLIVIEVDREGTFAQPAMPRFDAMISAYAGAAARRGGGMRTQLHQMPRIADGRHDWSVVREASIGAPFLGPFEGTKVARLYQGWVDICERTGGFEHPFDDVRSELSSWARASSAFSRLAGRILQLRYDPAA